MINRCTRSERLPGRDYSRLRPSRTHRPGLEWRLATTRRSETPTRVSEPSQSAAVKVTSARNCKLPTCGGVTHRRYFGSFVRAGGCIDLTQFPAPPSRSGVGDRWIKRNEVTVSISHRAARWSPHDMLRLELMVVFAWRFARTTVAAYVVNFIARTVRLESFGN